MGKDLHRSVTFTERKYSVLIMLTPTRHVISIMGKTYTPHQANRVLLLAHSNDIANIGDMAWAVISHVSPYFSQSIV